MPLPGLVECVPNFSEGRRPEVIDAIRNAMAATSGVRILGVSSDAWHNRTVITLAGPPEPLAQAVFDGIREARDRIDLTTHSGVHPRMGAADVIPFVPLSGTTMDDCVRLARELGDRVGRELHIPVYLYEYAASSPGRRNLAELRRGGFEKLRGTLHASAEREPDFGPRRIHPTAGAVAIGARKLLVAFNVYLGDASLMKSARAIARAIRESSGGLPGVKALAFEVNGQAQLSMNLVDLERTSLATAFEAVRNEAARHGIVPVRSEIVGLVPESALIDAGAKALGLDDFGPEQVLEHQIRQSFAASTFDDALDAIAAPTPSPGGGSAAALAGALGAALVATVAALSSRRRKGADQAAASEASGLLNELRDLARRDAKAYSAAVAASSSQGDHPTDKRAAALLAATQVPLETMRVCARVASLALEVSARCAPAARSDAESAVLLADAGCRAAALTARANLAALPANHPGAGQIASEMQAPLEQCAAAARALSG